MGLIGTSPCHIKVPKLFATPGTEPSDTLYCHCSLPPSRQWCQLRPVQPWAGWLRWWREFEGSLIVTLSPLEAAGPHSETGPRDSKNPALLRASTLEPGISCLYLFLEMKAIWKLFDLGTEDSFGSFLLTVCYSGSKISNTVLPRPCTEFQCRVLKVVLKCSASSSIFLTKRIRFKYYVGFKVTDPTTVFSQEKKKIKSTTKKEWGRGIYQWTKAVNRFLENRKKMGHS